MSWYVTENLPLLWSRIDSDGNEVEEEWDDTPEQEEEYSTSASIQVVPLKVKGPLPGSKISQIKTSIEKQVIIINKAVNQWGRTLQWLHLPEIDYFKIVFF